MLLELTKGAALLLALCYLETFIRRYLSRRPVSMELSLGILYGAICVVGMMTPIHFSDGVIFDARSVIIAIATSLGGPLCGAVATTLAAAYRYSLGGAGALLGIGVIVTSFAAGLLYRYGRARYGWGIGVPQLFQFGFCLQIACIFWIFLLPATSAGNVFQNMALLCIVVFTPATVLLGWMVRDTQNQIEIAKDLKQASKALGESERRFRAIFDNSPNGLTLKDEDGTFLIVNKTYARWQNLEVEEIIGKKLGEFHSHAQVQEILRVDRSVFSERQIITDESVREFADGMRRNVNVTKVPVTLADGEKQVVLSILTDITDIKNTEMELRRAYDEAVAANRSKSEFLARMSHEFRTPLNAILGFSDILRNQYLGGATVDHTVEYANDIHLSAGMLLALVDDVLDISAIEGGRVSIDYETIDVPALLSESLRTVSDRLNGKNIKTEMVMPEAPCRLSADRRALKQILLNLLTNAIKFTPSGGSIKLDLMQTDSDTSIVVSDTGIGIEAELLDNLMRPDAVLASNTYIAQEGWGLGLSIVRGLTELHGGHINIESSARHGTSVDVVIPNEYRACA